MRVHVDISRRAGISDPEGRIIAGALRDLGFAEVGDVHVGRSLVVEVVTDDPAVAEARVREMCERLLANPVIEDYTVEVER